MKYQEITLELNNSKHIQVDNGDGSFTSFPAENSNPNFIAFLQELEKENDPYFLAWVEAGNDPDEFWGQTETL